MKVKGEETSQSWVYTYFNIHYVIRYMFVLEDIFIVGFEIDELT